MAEKVVDEKLAGNEVIEAVVDAFRKALQQDGFLNSTTAYDFFKARIVYKIVANDLGREAVIERETNITQGEEPETDADLGQVEGVVEIEAKPPNQVRLESDQPIPVATVINGKPDIKRIKYAKNRVQVPRP